MDSTKLINLLLKVARANPPDDRVPYAFEKRIMARLQAVAPVDDWTAWGQSLWRGALLSCGIMLLCCMWWMWPSPQADFSQDFQGAVLAQASQVDYGFFMDYAE